MSSTGNTHENRSATANRRRFMAVVGAGAAVVFSGSQRTAGKRVKRQEVFTRGHQVEIDGDPEEIIAKAYQLGHEYEKNHGGCAQCTVAALQDAVAFVPRDQGVFRAGSCLDGGATPTGLHNCGAFTGSGIVIGNLCGRTRGRRGKEFRGGSGFSHDLIRKVCKRFEEEYGSVLCQDVKKGAGSDCPKVVGTAAKWTAEVLLEEFTDYGKTEDAD